MSNEAKTEYLNSIREEYRKGNRKKKSEILAHAYWVTKLSCNRLIKRLNEDPKVSAKRKRGPSFKYGPDLLPHIKALWFLMEQPCAVKLKVLIPTLLNGYRKRRSDLTDEQAKKLLSMSPSTIDRMLKEIRVQRGLCTTKAPTSQWYKTAIPVQPNGKRTHEKLENIKSEKIWEQFEPLIEKINISDEFAEAIADALNATEKSRNFLFLNLFPSTFRIWSSIFSPAFSATDPGISRKI